MFPRHSRPAGPFARFAHLFSAPGTAGRKPRRRRSLAAHSALRLESLESRAMLSSAPFIASLPQDLAGKTASLVTVHGRYGNNALNGDWELGLTSNTGAPPQHQINRTWNSGTREPFTFSFTNTRPDTFTNSLNATFSIGGSGVQFDYGSQFASYEPNAIKIWARTATATSSLTINDLRITTPGVTGQTVFPGASIAVSQASGTVFQEIIIAGIDFQSVSGGTVTLQGNVTMQFGTDPALRGSALQFHVIATHIPWVDLDVDSNNNGSIDPVNGRNGTDDRIEQAAPGKIIPVGGARAEMLVTLPAGRSATLEIDAAVADKIRVHKVKDRTQNTPLTFSPATANTPAKLDLSLLQPTSTTGTLNTWQLWVEALAASTTAGDLVFTLTGDSSGPPARDIVRATAVAVDLDVDSNNDGRIDPVNEPDGTDDPIEHAPTRGLVVPVYAGDADADGLKDTLDFNGINGRRFAPVKVTLSTGAAYAWTNPIRPSGSPAEDLPGLTFTFTFSDAGLVPAAAGLFRLWKKDAQFVRTEADLIRTGVPIAATELFAGARFTTLEEYLSTYGTTTLYLEAVAPAEGYEPIVVSIGGTGAWANSTTIDTVHARALETTFDLGVDSNNNEGFGVPKRSPLAEKRWEEKLENHAYALGKLVMQSSSAQIGDTIAEDRLAASFTPVVVELPKNLPVDARSIGVEFATGPAGALDGGEIRLWTRNKGPDLRWEDAAGQPHPLLGEVFGDRVNFDKPYTLSQINYDPITGAAVLYIDGHVPTKKATLHDVEQQRHFRGILQATLTFDAPNARLSLADDSVQYMVVRDDFFYHDLQFGSVGLRSAGSQVRSALASRGVYSYADLPNFALKRLTTRKDPKSPPGELQDILELDPNSDAVALLYNDADKPGNPTAYPGFKAVLYQDYAAVADNTFVLAFGGTDDSLGEVVRLNPPDWVENIGQGLGWRIAEYRWAMDVARAVDAARLQVPGGATLTTTGHSLGGGLASAASVVTGRTGVTFNAAGLHEKTLRMYFENDPAELAVALARYQNPQGLVTAYTVDWDFLSNFQDRLSLVVNAALGDRKKLDGPYDLAANTLILIDSAVNVAGASPIGVLVKLGINVATKAGLGYLMVRAHSMDVVLYGMLVEERTNRDLLGYPRSRFL